MYTIVYYIIYHITGITEHEISGKDGLREAEPNAAHRALVELEDLGKLQTVPRL